MGNEYKNWDEDLKELYQGEIKYLKSAMKALRNDELLKVRFGYSLHSAMAVADLMRQETMIKEVKDRLEQYIPASSAVASNAPAQAFGQRSVP